MRNPARAFTSYQALLRVLTDGAVAAMQRVAAEMRPEPGAGPPVLDFSTVVRQFCVLSMIIRRSIVVSRYIETIPVPVEERDGRLMQAFDQALKVFAQSKVDIDVYTKAIDAKLDGDVDEDLDDDDDWAELNGNEWDDFEADPDADVPGRPPAALVAELCRDFGMAAHGLPAQWLDPVPTELRFMCARAAAASIRPAKKPKRHGRP